MRCRIEYAKLHKLTSHSLSSPARYSRNISLDISGWRRLGALEQLRNFLEILVVHILIGVEKNWSGSVSVPAPAFIKPRRTSGRDLIPKWC
jgi:hypothetical protein